jgi:hypothetical protein
MRLFGLQSKSGKTYHKVKSICAKYGLILSAKHKQKRINGKQTNIILNYVIKNNVSIMNILKILIKDYLFRRFPSLYSFFKNFRLWPTGMCLFNFF